MKKFAKNLPQLAKKGKNRAILVVSLSILILSGTIIHDIMDSHDHLVENNIALKNSHVEEVFHNLEKNSYDNYKSRIKNLVSSNEELISLFAKKDREQLYAKAQPLYEMLKAENPYFKVMHFHLADGASFLRMHKPDYFDDNLRGVRPIVDEVHQNHVQQSGFEIGRHGPFYRIVQPVFFNNNYIGALEFGIQTCQLVKTAKSELTGQNATYFLREEWAKVTNPLNHLKRVRTMGEFVLNTHGSELFKSLPDTFNINAHGERIDIEDNNYIFYSWPVFKDFQGRPIGGIAFFQNISDLVGQKRNHILESSAVIICLTFLCLFTLFFCLNNLTENITDYHESLIENETILLKAQNLAHIGSWRFDLKQKTLSWSEEVYRIFGVSPLDYEPAYETFLHFIHPEDRELVVSEYSRSVENNNDYNLTHRIVRPNGEVRIVRQQAENIPDSSGTTIASIGMIHDITDFKMTENSLRESKVQWRKTFHSIQDIVTIQDPEMNIVKINQAGCDFLGVSEQEALGKPCYELFHGSDEPCFGCPLLVTKESFQSYSKEITHEKRGKIFLVNASVVLNDDGKLQYIVHVAKDVTEKKKIESQLFLNEKLATIAGLAAGVAHEINNPLSVILQSQQVIRMRLDPTNHKSTQRAAEHGIDLTQLNHFLQESKVESLMKGMHRSATKAGKIVKSLLEFSRPQQLDITEVNLPDLLENTLQLAHSDFSLKKKYDLANVRIEKDYDPQLATVLCFATEIEQVVLNLLQNAAYSLIFGKVKNPCINIQTLQTAEMARVEIADNGPGIDPKFRPRIFDPFFTTKDVGEGTGLGLFISHAIVVDRHKGNMWVESEPGEGAKFVFELPLSLTEETSQFSDSRDFPYLT